MSLPGSKSYNLAVLEFLSTEEVKEELIASCILEGEKCGYMKRINREDSRRYLMTFRETVWKKKNRELCLWLNTYARMIKEMSDDQKRVG